MTSGRVPIIVKIVGLFTEIAVQEFEVSCRSSVSSWVQPEGESSMKTTRVDIEGILLIELTLNSDERGFFIERFHQNRFREQGLGRTFVQDNHSRSRPRVLRGLHYQHNPPQGKLVGVVAGRIWDVAVDIRPLSPTYGGSFGCELSDLNGRMLWIPPGFAHGFCVLGEEDADVVYKVDAYYDRSGEGGIHWADSDLSIKWPIIDPIISERDDRLSSFAAYRTRPVVWDSNQK